MLLWFCQIPVWQHSSPQCFKHQSRETKIWLSLQCVCLRVKKKCLLDFLQGANILLTDNGDVKLGKLLFSVLILKDLNTSSVQSYVGYITWKALSILVTADFGVAAKITATIAKRKSFIGTPYWWVCHPHQIIHSAFDRPCWIGSSFSQRCIDSIPSIR